MADSAENKPTRSAADKERSRQQSRPVNAREPGRPSAAGGGGRGPRPPKNGRASGPPDRSRSGKGQPVGGRGAQAKKPSPGRRPSTPPRSRRVGAGRSPAALLTWGVVAVVLVIVIVLVTVKLTGGSSTSSVVKPGPVPATVLKEVTHVPASVFNTVGVSSPTVPVTPPKVIKDEPALEFTSKPGMLFVGGEFCPFCAAERWVVTATLSRFGTLSGLETMQSSSTDVDPNTQTFTFVHAKFTSPYVTAILREVYSNVETSTGGHALLQKLNKKEAALVKKYDVSTSATSSGSIPFSDVGNKVIFSGAAYSPSILAGLSRQQIASQLSNPKNLVTRAIVTASNYMSAGICSIDGEKPASVCTGSGVTAAAKALGITS